MAVGLVPGGVAALCAASISMWCLSWACSPWSRASYGTSRRRPRSGGITSEVAGSVWPRKPTRTRIPRSRPLTAGSSWLPPNRGRAAPGKHLAMRVAAASFNDTLTRVTEAVDGTGPTPA